jgi:hypothetical protein
LTVTRPLPGIRFEPQPRPLLDALPRMDIVAFVGFAVSGPLHTPVAVEDIGHFTMVFGDSVELPRRRGSRDARFAHLAPAVRSFFENGGRRCWIIRVAASHAIWNRFAVPGLFEVRSDGSLKQAWMYARSQGSWSEALRVQTNLRSQPLPLVAFNLADPAAATVAGRSRDIAAGDLIRFSWIGGDVSLYLFATSCEPVVEGTSIKGRRLWIRKVMPSPVDGNATFHVTTPLLTSPPGAPAVERLAFDVTVRTEDAPPLRMPKLGLMPEHARYCGALPADVALFEDPSMFGDVATPAFTPKKRERFPANFTGSTEAPETGWPELWRESASPRFPLAIYGAADDAQRRSGSVYAPLGMTELLSSEQKFEPANGTSLHRDGLDVLSADLFLDQRLRDTAVRDVLNHADVLRYQAGATLTGIHAALAIEEATLIAVPDAVHSGWEAESDSTIESPSMSSPLAHPELLRWMDCREARPSQPPAVIGGFVDCDALVPIIAPSLTVEMLSAVSYRMTWSAVAETTDELQEATRPDFSDAAVIALGDVGEVTLYGRPAGDYFYRIRRLEGARTSEWSAGLAVRVTGIAGFVSVEEKGDVAHLPTVHEAMVRMAAARGDLVAILSLPRHYDEERALSHTAGLVAAFQNDRQTLSYGALWHPWLVAGDDAEGRLREMPPDGAIAGVIAARASARGAWVAPANEPLRGVLGLIPSIPPSARQTLQDAAVNLIRQEPKGFLCLDSDTLSEDPDVRPLNVRRLLILVRRAALRTGNEYAFEPNSFSLRNTLKRGFEALLALMFARGAFAGRDTRSAYQVVTDETVNTPQSTDQGRLIAELRIAPSRPLSFMTIRLLRRADAAAAVEVR